MSSFRAWMPSKMAISFFPSFQWGAPGRRCASGGQTQIWGMMISSPRLRAAKCWSSSSISRHWEIQSRCLPSGVWGAVLGSGSLK